jgi:predicted DNA-binding protein (UPF0251 family)
MHLKNWCESMDVEFTAAYSALLVLRRKLKMQYKTHSSRPSSIYRILKEVMKLPVKYRLALMLRDLEELSTEEAASALGLSIPGLKARVLRGRLMLRESMVQYFSKAGAGKS